MICRRCGERLGETHIRSPYLCAFNPDRDAVGEAIRQQTPASKIARKSIRAVGRNNEPTTCGRCDYDEAEGGLIDQCAACKEADRAAQAQGRKTP